VGRDEEVSSPRDPSAAELLSDLHHPGHGQGFLARSFLNPKINAELPANFSL
jgi:hypothetical protein